LSEALDGAADRGVVIDHKDNGFRLNHEATGLLRAG
jgi:hypothetical protein